MATDNLMPQSSMSIIKHFMLRSSTTGQGLTGKTSTDFTGKYNIAGGTETTLSFSSGAQGDAYSSGKIVPLGLGKYAWHVPNALFVTLGHVTAVLSVTGGIDVHFEWVVAVDDRTVLTKPVNVTQISGVAQSATDLKDFVDTGYDPATHKVQGVVLVDTVTTYTGNTPQTGDSFARLGVNGAGLTSLATAAQINSLAVNTRANLQIPVEIENPDASTQVYKIRLFLFDVEGNMEAPDSTPTVALVNAAGTSRAGRLSAATNPGTGVYSWDYTATVGDAEEQLVWTFTVVEGTLTRTYPATSYVVEETAYRFSSTDRATLNATATGAALTTLSTKIGTPVGASLVADVATRLPTASYVAPPAVGLIADAVWDELLAGHTVSGSAGLALSTASSGGVDPAVLADAIWDELRSGHTTPGSFGFYVDMAISSVSGGVGLTQADVRTAIGMTVANLDSQLWGINSKTVNLPADPADASDIAAAFGIAASGISALSAKIGSPVGASVSVDVAAVKADTASLLTRITAPVYQLFLDLKQMILGTTTVNAQWTVKALELAPAGGGAGGPSNWTVEQVEYALAQLALLEMNGSAVVIPAGEFLCTRGDIEQVFGTVSVAKWADLNNTGDVDEIAGRINYRIAMADNYIRSILDNSQWQMPAVGDNIPAVLAYNTASLAGVYLYEARGVQDYNAAGFAQHQLSYHKKNVEDFLKGVLVGSISLKPLTYSIASAAPEAS